MEEDRRWRDTKAELDRANSELIRRRAEAKAEEIKQHKYKIDAIKKHLSKGEHDKARDLAAGLRETLLFGDIILLFEKKPEIFLCDGCSWTMEGMAFKKNSLRWVRPRLCDACEQKERESETDRLRGAFRNFLRGDMNKILTAVGVDELLLRASYDGFSEDVVQSCKRSVSGKHGLYIWGEVGRGKTFLSVAALKEIITTREIPEDTYKSLMRDCSKFRELFRFVYVPGLLMDLRASYRYKSYDSEQTIISDYTKLDLLILDDIGVEKPSEWVRGILNTIIYYRNVKGLKTIYTSNMGPDELRERLDERITSRIMQQCEIIRLVGPDRRRQ